MTAKIYEKITHVQIADVESTEVKTHIYPRWLLSLYDFAILGVISSWAWRCSTKKVQVPFFRENLGKNHVDIGVGTGYYLVKAGAPKDTKFTLVDLNENPLKVTKARFGREDVTLIQHDIFERLPTTEKFDSMSLFYFLHCLPGPLSKKMAIFEHLKRNLTRDGVCYGSTILGTGVPYNWFARWMRQRCNDKGILDNWMDNKEEIVAALEQHFEKVEAEVVGTILIFKARGPKL